MSEMKKSYYAIIPAFIRYDKNLSPNCKLLYGEITALCNEKGYCWANNDYFAQLYNVSKQTVSSWIKQLKDNGYINADLIYKDGTKEILYRCITISECPIQKNIDTSIEKDEYSIKEKLNTPIQKKTKDNNTYINNTNNITSNKKSKKFIPPTVEEVKKYCEERNNNVDAENFVDFYTAKDWKIGKNRMKDWKAAVRTWERNNRNEKRKNNIQNYNYEITFDEEGNIF
jgi:DNA-binding transcriptional ArsR family regulator